MLKIDLYFEFQDHDLSRSFERDFGMTLSRLRLNGDSECFGFHMVGMLTAYQHNQLCQILELRACKFSLQAETIWPDADGVTVKDLKFEPINNSRLAKEDLVSTWKWVEEKPVTTSIGEYNLSSLKEAIYNISRIPPVVRTTPAVQQDRTPKVDELSGVSDTSHSVEQAKQVRIVATRTSTGQEVVDKIVRLPKDRDKESLIVILPGPGLYEVFIEEVEDE